jgi:hypothetical protein
MEGFSNCKIAIFIREVLAGVFCGKKGLSGNIELNMDFVMIALVVVLVGNFYHDVTTDNPFEVAFETLSLI